MDDIESILFGIMSNNYETAEKIGNDRVGEYTIDTCYTADFGYETAIWLRDHPMVIVERYVDSEGASIGHKKWCDFCKNNPTVVWSVQDDEYCTL